MIRESEHMKPEADWRQDLMPQDLTLETPLVFHHEVTVVETEENYVRWLLGAFLTMANCCRVGGSVLRVDLKEFTVGDAPPRWFPPDLSDDVVVHSVTWETAFTAAQALLWSRLELGKDYLAELCDRWLYSGYSGNPEMEFGDLNKELINRLAHLNDP